MDNRELAAEVVCLAAKAIHERLVEEGLSFTELGVLNYIENQGTLTLVVTSLIDQLRPPVAGILYLAAPIQLQYHERPLKDLIDAALAALDEALE